MQGKTHLMGGALSGLTVAYFLGNTEPRQLAVAAITGAACGLIPDWLQINIPWINRNIKGATGHRGFSHWLLTACAVAWAVATLIPARSVSPWYCLAGWVSHIALDAFAGGVPAFWPIGGRLTLARIKTGSKMDTLVGACCLVLSAVLAIVTLQPSILLAVVGTAWMYWL
jgi:membrane-bound metal-dependent hydrolase YbcI (DUF457 family)